MSRCLYDSPFHFPLRFFFLNFWHTLGKYYLRSFSPARYIFQISLRLYDNVLCKSQTATQRCLYRLEKRLYFRNENRQNQFGFKSNLKIHELSYDFPIDLRERSYCTVYFQRFNAKGIRLKKLACPRMQLERYRLSKETLSSTFYKNRCSSCDDKKKKKSVALLAAGKSRLQLAFQKISIYNVLTDRRARTKKR